SARHHRRTRRNRPRGVAPSPSNLLARMPPRPSTTESERGPTVRMPRVRLPGRARTRIRESAFRRMQRPSKPVVEASAKVAIRLPLYPRMLYFAHAVPGRCGSWGPDMTNTRKILIVDDDSELREALVEQLALHEEFESIAVDNGTKGVQAAKAGQI